MRVFLAVVLLTIFSIQVLPVKELGELLCKGTMTEEISEAETESRGEDLTVKWNSSKEYNATISYSNELQIARFTAIVEQAIHAGQYICRQYIPDISTPPPDAV